MLYGRAMEYGIHPAPNVHDSRSIDSFMLVDNS